MIQHNKNIIKLYPQTPQESTNKFIDKHLFEYYAEFESHHELKRNIYYIEHNCISLPHVNSILTVRLATLLFLTLE